MSSVRKWFGVDTQVNGGRLEQKTDGANWIDYTAKGENAGEAGFTIAQCASHVRRLRRLGTRAFCPTLVTADEAVLRANLRQLDQFIGTTEEGKHCPGIHLEACYFPQTGSTGAHADRFCVTPPATPDLYHRLQEASGGKIKIMTVGIMPGIEQVIEQAVSDGVHVQLGHFGPKDPLDERQILRVNNGIQRAVDAGARGATHLGNGTNPSSHRHGGHIDALLMTQQICPSIITDGSHLPETFIRKVLGIRGRETLLVSDAAQYEGWNKPGVYSSWGGDVEIVPADGTCKICLPNKPGQLAGSWETLPACVEYFVHLLRRWNRKVTEHIQLTLEDIVYMSCLLPLRILGLNLKDVAALEGETVNLTTI